MEAVVKRKAEWQNNYNAKNYDRIGIFIPKGEKDQLKAHVEKYGKGITSSVNGYIKQAIKRAMEQDLIKGVV